MRPQQIVEIGFRRRRPLRVRAWRGSSARSLPGCGRGAHAGRGSRCSDSSRSARVSPMPIRMPVVNGTASSPAMPHHLQPHRGRLVGRAVMHAARLAQPLAAQFQHDAHAGRHLAQRRDLVARHHAGIDVRQQPGLLQHQRAHLAQVARSSSRARAPPAPRARRGSAVPACRRG